MCKWMALKWIPSFDIIGIYNLYAGYFITSSKAFNVQSSREKTLMNFAGFCESWNGSHWLRFQWRDFYIWLNIRKYLNVEKSNMWMVFHSLKNENNIWSNGMLLWVIHSSKPKNKKLTVKPNIYTLLTISLKHVIY